MSQTGGKKRGSFLFRFHRKIGQTIFLRKNSSLAKKDLRLLLNGTPIVTINSTDNPGFVNFNPDDKSKLKAYNPDFIIKLAYGVCANEILSLPAHGVWSFSMKDFGSEAEDTTGYSEVMKKEPVTAEELVIIKGNVEKNTAITRVFESTCSYSQSINRDKVLRRASLFIPRVTKGLYYFGPDYLKMLEERYYSYDPNIIRKLSAPSFLHAARNIVISMVLLISKILKKLIYTDAFSWNLLYNIGTEKDFLKNNYGTFKCIKPPKDKFWADPFVIDKAGKYFVFVEEFIYKRNKGHISVLELDKEGRLLNVSKIIEASYHISYPFIFEKGDTYYMIPETGGNRTIDLYKCSEFPGKWVFIKTIMQGVNAVDTTLFYHGGKWWLFTVIDKINSALGASPELYLFFNDDFLSDNWISHPLNPVVTDVRNARAAGKVFIREGKIYRPSQDCSERYGNSFDINLILTLTESDYKEEKVLKVKPEWDKKLKGTHTFNFDGDFTIIDAYTFRRRFI